MPEAAIGKDTCWECQKCGACCRDIVMLKGKSLAVVKDGKPVCKFFNEEKKLCTSYAERPFICKLYPFVIDLDKIKAADHVARPQLAFRLENLKIHTECPGYGKGQKIAENRALLRKFEKLALEFAENYKRYIDKEIGLFDVI
jgi:Fe-S-cluster containining protein